MKLLDILEDSALAYIENNYWKDFNFIKEGLLFQVNEIFHEQLRKEVQERLNSYGASLELSYLEDFTITFQGVPCKVHFEIEDIDNGPSNTFLSKILDIVLKS